MILVVSSACVCVHACVCACLRGCVRDGPLCLSPAGRVVVYGGSLAVFTAVEGLLQLGVRGGDITLVHPSPPACFNNLSVEGRVALELGQAGTCTVCGRGGGEGYSVLSSISGHC